MQYYLAKDIACGFEEAIEKAKAALAREGFGILTEVDVKNVLEQRTGHEFRPYVILGACQPHFARQALEAEDKVGVFLPCNVVVQQHTDGRVEVAAMNPGVMGSATGNAALTEVAAEAQAAIERVLAAL